MRIAIRLAALAPLLAGLAAPPAGAISFQTLYSFRGGADGASPYGRPLLGRHGLIYGTTILGGSGNGGTAGGTVFQFDTTTATKTILYNFTLGGPTGSEPSAALIADHTGNLYGMTETGGSTTHCSYGCGVVFRLRPSTGVITILHTFSGLADGREPLGELVFGPDGKLYGTTELGGATTGNCGSAGCGTVFQLDPATRQLVTLHDFTGPPGDGADPDAGLVFDANGLLYGTTSIGSTGSNNGSGAVFRLDPGSNAYTVLHYFDYHTDGDAPSCTLAFSKGVLYGTTDAGGPTDAADGTLFSIDPSSGLVATLHSFQGRPGDGQDPSAGVTPNKAGVLLGTTQQGGSGSIGTIFSFNPATQAYKLLHSFANSTDGAVPTGGLAVAGNGVAYGVTSYGNGTLYSIKP